MNEFMNEPKEQIDMAEIYRQDYMDALEEIRNLRFELAEVREALNARIEEYVANMDFNVKRD